MLIRAHTGCDYMHIPAQTQARQNPSTEMGNWILGSTLQVIAAERREITFLQWSNNTRLITYTPALSAQSSGIVGQHKLNYFIFMYCPGIGFVWFWFMNIFCISKKNRRV